MGAAPPTATTAPWPPSSGELLTYMLADPKTISRAIRLILISRFLERVADHATNIAEMVIYMVESKMVRHQPA
jgi:phosphate transport system protein